METRTYQIGNEEIDIFNEAGAFYFQAIENADGIPFRLIFGPEIGEGYYPNNGGGMKDLLGISPGDLTEKKFLEMIEEIIPLSSDIPSDISVARKLFTEGIIRKYKADLKIRTSEGKIKWIRESSLPIIDRETGKVIGEFGILYDVSHQRNNHSPAPEPDDAIRLKSAFLRNVSHEIRTPLNAIVGLSSLIGEPGQSPEQIEEFRDIMVKSSDHLLEVVMNIIEMSKIDSGMVVVRKENVNISLLIQKIYDQFSKIACDKGLKFNLELRNCDNDIYIMADMAKLSQALRNIVGNAIKFTTKGEVIIGIEQLNDIVSFFVYDTGPGIPVDQQQNIYKSFYQVESSVTRNYGGIGLGLSIAKSYIELMGSKLTLVSRPEKGSCFRFSLPK